MEKAVAVETKIINCYVPKDFTEESLNILEILANSDKDDVMQSEAVSNYLNYKWNLFGRKFYLAQFVLYVLLLISVSVTSFSVEPISLGICFYTGFAINTYFTIYECTQLLF